MNILYILFHVFPTLKRVENTKKRLEASDLRLTGLWPSVSIEMASVMRLSQTMLM